MKKLSLKQRMRKPKPRRKLLRPPYQDRSASHASPGIKGYVVRLPPEPHPHPEEGRPSSVPAYVGWGGRALHIQAALLVPTPEDAARVAAAFPGASVEPCDLDDGAASMEVNAWMDVATPVGQQRDALFSLKTPPISGEERQKVKDLEQQQFASLTIPDDRAPRDEAQRPQVIERLLWEHYTELDFILRTPT